MTRKGKFFLNFSPAVSNKEAKAIRDTVRSWKLPHLTSSSTSGLVPAAGIELSLLIWGPVHHTHSIICG